MDELLQPTITAVYSLSSSTSSSHSDRDSDYEVPSKKRKKDPPSTYDWTGMLNRPGCIAANVSWFKHAPVSHLWTQIDLGLKVEVENVDECSSWVASIIKLKGYKALLRYQGLEDDPSEDFWVHLCSEDVHHLGWSEMNGKLLNAPKYITSKLAGLEKREFDDDKSLPLDFQSEITADLTPKFLGSNLEAVDINNTRQVRLASVEKIIEKRWYMKYWDSDDGFWCHEQSSLIHPSGWAFTVGHDIEAPASYRPAILPKTDFNTSYGILPLREGMKLEVVDPENFLDIRCATVKKVLKYGYIMLQVDGSEGDTEESDWFCHHVLSPYIFPCGFSDKHGLKLIPPPLYKKDELFHWNQYLAKTKSCAASLRQWTAETEIEHSFREEMKIEAADLKNPEIICPATVSKVVGRLLKIRFDGWEDEYDQWVDATSTDIYPVGWAELVGYHLEVPPSTSPVPTQVETTEQMIPTSNYTPQPILKSNLKAMTVSNVPSFSIQVNTAEQKTITIKQAQQAMLKFNSKTISINEANKLPTQIETTEQQATTINNSQRPMLKSYSKERSVSKVPSFSMLGDTTEQKTTTVKQSQQLLLKSNSKSVTINEVPTFSTLGDITEIKTTAVKPHQPTILKSYSKAITINEVTNFSTLGDITELKMTAVKPPEQTILKCNSKAIAINEVTNFSTLGDITELKTTAVNPPPQTISKSNSKAVTINEVPIFSTLDDITELKTTAVKPPQRTILKSNSKAVTINEVPKFSTLGDITELKTTAVKPHQPTILKSNSKAITINEVTNFSTLGDITELKKTAANPPQQPILKSNSEPMTINKVVTSARVSERVIRSTSAEAAQNKLPQNSMKEVSVASKECTKSSDSSTMIAELATSSTSTSNGIANIEIQKTDTNEIVATSQQIPTAKISGQTELRLSLMAYCDDNPALWSVLDVAEFLIIHSFPEYCPSFLRKKVNGSKLLTLTKRQIDDISGKPKSSELVDLINELRKVVPARVRTRSSAASVNTSLHSNGLK